MAIEKEIEIIANTEGAIESIENLGAAAKKTEQEIREEKRKTEEEAKKAAREQEQALREVDKLTGGYIGKVKDLYKSFTAIPKVLKGLGSGFTSAFKAGIAGANGMKKALIASGIGALVVALGVIVAYWDEILGLVNGVSSAQKSQLEAAEANVTAQEEASELLALQENSLRLQGKSEKEIRDLKIQQTNETIAALEAQLETQKQIKQSQIEASNRNKQILQGIIRFLTIPISTLLGVIDMVGQALGKDFGLEESFSGGLAKLVFDPDEVAAEADETIKETEKQLAKLKSQRDGFLLQDQKERDAAGQKRVEDAKKVQQEILGIERETQKLLLDQWVNDVKDEQARENRRFAALKATLEKERLEKVAAANGNAELIAAINAQYQVKQEVAEKDHGEKILDIKEKNAEKVRALAQKVEDLEISTMTDKNAQAQAAEMLRYKRAQEAAQGNYELLELLKIEHEQKMAEIEANSDKEKQAHRDQMRDMAFNAANDLLGKLSDLNQFYDKDNEAAARKAFERNKSLQIAQTIVNTASGIMSAYSNPIDVASGVAFAKSASIASAGAIQIATIARQQFNDGSSKSSASTPKAAAPAGAQPQFNVVGQSQTNQLQEAISQAFNQPMRAYVVSSEVSSAQALDRKRIKTATFG